MGSSIDWSDFYPVREAREEGEEREIEKGKYELLLQLIEDETLTIEQAAKEMEISPEEMKQKIDELKKVKDQSDISTLPDLP